MDSSRTKAANAVVDSDTFSARRSDHAHAVATAANTRGGFTVVEVAVATVMVSVLLVVVAQMMSAVAQQRRTSRYRMIALEEAANLTELVMAKSYDQLTQDAITSVKLSLPARDALPTASLRIELLPIDAVPRGKRVTVEVAWGAEGEGQAKPIRVVAWKYDQGRGTP